MSRNLSSFRRNTVQFVVDFTRMAFVSKLHEKLALSLLATTQSSVVFLVAEPLAVVQQKVEPETKQSKRAGRRNQSAWYPDSCRFARLTPLPTPSGKRLRVRKQRPFLKRTFSASFRGATSKGLTTDHSELVRIDQSPSRSITRVLPALYEIVLD